jgi:hypothetical protein
MSWRENLDSSLFTSEWRQNRAIKIPLLILANQFRLCCKLGNQMKSGVPVSQTEYLMISNIFHRVTRAQKFISRDLNGETNNKLQSSSHSWISTATHVDNPPFHCSLHPPPSPFATAPLAAGSGHRRTIRTTSDAVIMAKDHCSIRLNFVHMTSSLCSDVRGCIAGSLYR